MLPLGMQRELTVRRALTPSLLLLERAPFTSIEAQFAQRSPTTGSAQRVPSQPSFASMAE